MSISTTGQLRGVLATALARAEKGELTDTDGRNIIGLANQITQSMATEIKMNNMKLRLGVQADQLGPFGSMGIEESKEDTK